jgi:hypothetical protein
MANPRQPTGHSFSAGPAPAPAAAPLEASAAVCGSRSGNGGSAPSHASASSRAARALRPRIATGRERPSILKVFTIDSASMDGTASRAACSCARRRWMQS